MGEKEMGKHMKNKEKKKKRKIVKEPQLEKGYTSTSV